MSTGRAIDRRVLRAFYTQYVSVLLILLVFSVNLVRGAVREASQSRPAVPQEISPLAARAPVIGKLRYGRFFASDQSSDVSALQELSAVFETLHSHDVRATFMVNLSLTDDKEENIKLARARVATLQGLFQAYRVLDEAVRVVVVPSLQHTSGITIDFESLEVPQ